MSQIQFPDLEQLKALWQGVYQQREQALQDLSSQDPARFSSAVDCLVDSLEPYYGKVLMDFINKNPEKTLLDSTDPMLNGSSFYKAAFAITKLNAYDCLPEFVAFALKKLESEDWIQSIRFLFSHFNSRHWFDHWPHDSAFYHEDASVYLTQEHINQWLPAWENGSESEYVRYNLVCLLGPILLPRNPMKIEAFLKDANADIRYRAMKRAQELNQNGHLHNSDYFFLVSPLLQDPDADIRSEALRLLGPILGDPCRYFRDRSPTPDELSNLQGEEYYYWMFEKQRYRSFISGLLTDPNLEIRTQALEYIIPWEPELARESLQGLYAKDRPYLNDALMAKFSQWPMEFHNLLKVLITPTRPILDLADFLDALRISRKDWPDLLEEWFEYPLSEANEAAIHAYQVGKLPLESALIYRFAGSESLGVQRALLNYLQETPYLNDENRNYFLGFFPRTHAEIELAVLKATRGQDIDLFAQQLMSDLSKTESDLTQFKVMCDYLVAQDAKVQTLSQSDWLTLLQYEPIQMAIAHGTKDLSMNLLEATLSQLEAGIELSAPNAIWQKVLAGLPAEHSFWKEARYVSLLLSEQVELRICLWRQLQRVFDSFKERSAILDLAVLELEDPVPEIRYSALKLIELGRRTEDFALIQQGLKNPRLPDVFAYLEIADSWELQDLAASVFDLLNHDMLELQIKAAKLLVKWQRVGPDSPWLQAQQGKVNPYPVALWPLLGFEPELDCVREYLSFSNTLFLRLVFGKWCY